MTCIAGMLLAAAFHMLSLQYAWLDGRYGPQRGRAIGDILGMVAGWAFFGLWALLWLLPQDRFVLPLYEFRLGIPLLDREVPVIHLMAGGSLLLAGAYLGLAGVRQTGLRTAERNRPDHLVTSGIYSRLRHPQYLGGLLSHLGITILLSAYWSLAITPVVVAVLYTMCITEERSLVRQFGTDYEDYCTRVPMLLPRLRATLEKTTDRL